MSLISSPIDIALRKAAIFWPAFFSMMHDMDDQKMNRSKLKSGLQRCVDFFQLSINYYSSIKSKPNYLCRLKIRVGKAALNKVIKSKVDIEPSSTIHIELFLVVPFNNGFYCMLLLPRKIVVFLTGTLSAMPTSP